MTAPSENAFVATLVIFIFGALWVRWVNVFFGHASKFRPLAKSRDRKRNPKSCQSMGLKQGLDHLPKDTLRLVLEFGTVRDLGCVELASKGLRAFVEEANMWLYWSDTVCHIRGHLCPEPAMSELSENDLLIRPSSRPTTTPLLRNEVYNSLRSLSLFCASYHARKGSCYVVVSRRVYDLTEFQKIHPGGGWILLEHSGYDATRAFDMAAHSDLARESMGLFMAFDETRLLGAPSLVYKTSKPAGQHYARFSIGNIFS